VVETLASAHGFRTVRYAAVSRTPHFDAFERWLTAGHHATMTWMTQNREIRGDPRTRLPTARTAVILALHHHHRRPPDPGPHTGKVARYAWGRDYHNLMGKRLKRLTKALRTEGISCWGGVDTAPIIERAWAAEAGMGFTGKNCVQIIPATSSWFFLGVIFLDVEIAPDPPLRDHCGTCQRCLDACPTEAFLGARDLDARRCISYWTIESRGLPPRSLRQGFGRWVFGCDVCQEVCPHNVATPDADEDDFLPRNAWLDCEELIRTPDDALMTRFLGTPLRRPKAAGLKRNALIVLGNSGDDAVVPAVRGALSHSSPVVRGAAVWALQQLGDTRLTSQSDPDPMVQAELRGEDA
jgi:epoxyqueuosine reductase